ncbi:DNA polymerase III subunit gamma/tau [bacterium]|nr:DNA polymerase III subunit gamma/tau [bacterium]
MEHYLVLARKYRPSLFADIVGQPHVVKTLKNALRSKRLGHSFLFSGPRGIGKTTTARILAKALNCASGPAEEPCNECEHCREITAGSALDVFEIDGASNNSVEDIRQIRERVQYNPTKSRYKIYIIDEVHMLSNSAFNALLKTLEEPPAHVIFMFATTEVHKIPITIISRCQHYELRLLTVSEITASCQKILESEHISCSSAALRMIARAAEGSLRDAQSLLDQIINISGQNIGLDDVRFALGAADPDLLTRLLSAIVSGEAEQILLIIDQFAATGYDLYQLCKDLIYSFRNLLMISLVSKPQEILDLSEDEHQELKKITQNCSIDHLEFALYTLTELENTIKGATYPRFLLETTVIRIARYADLVPVTDILKRLDHLKQSLLDNGLGQLTETTPTSPVSQPLKTKSGLQENSRQEADHVHTQPDLSSDQIESDDRPVGSVEERVPEDDERTGLPEASPLEDLSVSPDEQDSGPDQTETPDPDNSEADQAGLVREIPNIDPEQVTGTWVETVKRIGESKQSLAMVLENCFLISCDQNSFVLAIRKEDELSWKMLDDRNNQALVMMTFANLAGFRPKLELACYDDSRPGYSIQVETKKREQERFQELQEHVLKKPYIQQTLDLFEGKISSIIECDTSEGEGE